MNNYRLQMLKLFVCAGLLSAVSASAGSATQFLITAPSGYVQTVGVSFHITVTAADGFGGTDTSYTGTVHFTSPDGLAVLPGDATLTNGTGTFPVTFNTISPFTTVTATDTVTPSITGISSPLYFGDMIPCLFATRRLLSLLPKKRSWIFFILKRSTFRSSISMNYAFKIWKRSTSIN